MTAMLTALMPRSRVKVLALLLLRAGTDHYLREVARLSDVPLRAAQRELARLTEIGLVAANRRGHQLFFKVDTHHPLFADLRSLLVTSEGVAAPLRAAIADLAGIEAAVLLEPDAGDADDAGPFELLVVGNPDQRRLRAAIAAVATDIGRGVSLTLIGADDLAARRAAGDPLLARATSDAAIPVVGDPHAIE